MNNNKFDRAKPHANISDIVSVGHDKITTKAALELVRKNYEKREQKVLQDLINEYGEEEGKRLFEILKQESAERYQAILNISNPEENVSFFKKR